MAATITSSRRDRILEVVSSLQSRHLFGRSNRSRKDIGQFFTPIPVARCMASMFAVFPETIRLLDPGAGAGILTAAVCERIGSLRKPRHVDVHVYETDDSLLPALHATLAECRDFLAARGHGMQFSVHPKDFILCGPNRKEEDDLFGSTGEPDFDAVVMNPPYLKIARDSAYAKVMANIVHGQPNLYALFMSLGASALRSGGELVAITPRSFASGPYFRSFRRWFLSRMSLHRLHLFESRTDTFSEAKVLQENVITYARRQGEAQPEVVISQSSGRDASKATRTLLLPSSFVVDDAAGDAIIRVPTSEQEAAVIREVEAWPTRFDKLGLRVSTGRVVMFRAAKFVKRGHRANGTIPLLSVQNVRPFRTVWPVESARKTLSLRMSPETERLLIPSSNYVLVRRFSAKEESRRLTASPLLAAAFGGPWVALENHVNYIYRADRELAESEALGIVAILNSRLLDVYFRTISGNTQVNAAEIRAMPFPDLPALAKLGDLLAGVGTGDRRAVESMVMETLNVDRALRQFLVAE